MFIALSDNQSNPRCLFKLLSQLSAPPLSQINFFFSHERLSNLMLFGLLSLPVLTLAYFLINLTRRPISLLSPPSDKVSFLIRSSRKTYSPFDSFSFPLISVLFPTFLFHVVNFFNFSNSSGISLLHFVFNLLQFFLY